MPQKLTLATVTANDLRAGVYSESFPEYYALEGLIENSLWHTKQDILAHVIKVFGALEKLLEFHDLDAKQADAARVYLQERCGVHTREELLKAYTLLHDIAKSITLVTKSDGSAGCPGHEHIGASMVVQFQEVLELDEVGLEYAERAVLHHGFAHDILTLALAHPEQADFYWDTLEVVVGDIAYELLLLMRADVHGSDLATTAPAEFQERDELMKQWMREKAPSA